MLCGSVGLAAAQRLPGGVRPEHYALTITPDLAAASFRGAETIDLVLDHASDSITLNAAEISFVNVMGASIPPEAKAPATWQTAAVTPDSTKEQATFHFAQALPAGQVTLRIEYTGILNDKLRGFYLSRTKARSYGVTQFEATDARRAFPSFDEPALKATFEVTLVVDAGDTAISNTPLVSDSPGPEPGKHTLHFAPTPRMSTYLVAWLVGDFACTEGKADGVPIRACATPDKVNLTHFSLETAKWALHYYDTYFGIKYAMAKLDMVAVPDFEAGAMENFGCILYRETEMLVDEKDGGVPAKKEVATTVAHEMSHQWFGDMVTMAWWDNLWLNEGFATWMESKAAAKWRPQWQYDQDVAVERDETLTADAQTTTRAIRARAETPAEINELFDDIAYGKAGAVIGMVENWVGEEVFRKGVHEYLAAHLYGNATAEDFWGVQTRVSGLPVDRVMQSFVDQPGVPLVAFEPAPDGHLAMTQRQFPIPAGHSPSSEESRGESSGGEGSRSWTIPICLKGAACQLLPADSAGLALTTPTPAPAFVFTNAGDKGYYRTAYAGTELAPLVAHAEADLTPPERIGLVGDLWALMGAGRGTVADFLNLALALKEDLSPTVVASTLDKIGRVRERIASEQDRDRLNAVVRAEFGPVYAALGKPGKREPWDRAELRGTLFEALGEAGDPSVLAEAESVARQLFAGQKPADAEADIADAAVALAAQHGNPERYDRLLRVARNAKEPDLKVEAMQTLTRFDDPTLVARTLAYAVSDEVRSQDGWGLIASLLGRRETQDQAWEFIERHWPEIARRATESSGVRIIEATGSFCSVQRRDEVAGFFAQHPVESSERTLAKAIDSIDACVHLRAAQEPELRRWLNGRDGSRGNVSGEVQRK